MNLQTHPIDVLADHPEGSPESYYAEKWKDKDLPHMLVYFTNNAPEPQLAWSAQFNDANVANLLESPARKEAVERLLDGQTAVWMLLKTGDEKADRRAEEELKQELAKKPDEIELPSLTDLESEEKFDEELPVEMRVEFSVISIDPKDEKETFFREMLLNTEADLRDFNEPIAIPIYGRGRTYFALVGQGITSDNIDDNCNFICGACSCEVKRDNPGQDLLLAANWNRVQPGNWVNDTPLPELTGIGGLESIVGDEVADEPTDETDELAMAKTTLTSTASSDHETETAELTKTESPMTTKAIVTNETDSGTVAPMVLLWGAILFGVGLVFTVWQRSQNSD